MKHVYSTLMFQAALICLIALSCAPVGAQEYSINADRMPQGNTGYADFPLDIGYLLTPTSTFDLASVTSTFAFATTPTDVHNVRVGIFTKSASGFVLVSSTIGVPRVSIDSRNNYITEFDMSRYLLTAGDEYLVGFENLGNVGDNTSDSGGTEADGDAAYYDYGNKTFDLSYLPVGGSFPIITLSSTPPAPEASTLQGLLLCLCGSAALILLKRRKRKSSEA